MRIVGGPMDELNELRAVIFDWAGTTVDFGSRAPMGAFVEIFARFGVAISIIEARRPMGLPKRDHIAALMADEAIATRWRKVHGTPPSRPDIDAVYTQFIPLNASVVADHADLIPGLLPVVETLRSAGLKIGSTTGYTRDIMARLAPAAAASGYRPDNLVCAGDLIAGRPTPLMMYRCFADLGVYPPWRIVKVDDTGPGIAEAAAAGAWAVGVTLSGNGCGLTPGELAALSSDERDEIRARVGAGLADTGAHATIDTVADLVPALAAIGARIRAGERP
jgi:phosphonoacetaldehyde hydrolase